MLTLRAVIVVLLLFCVMAVLPLNVYAVRRPDVANSQNGEVFPASLCPDSVSTPFFAPLDGTQIPPTTCVPTSDPNKPNPPSPFPNLSVTLSGSGFTVTITPALWQIGLGKGTSNAASKHTVFQVEFTGESGMTLQSLVINSKLNGATYVPCVDPQFGQGIPYCVALDDTLVSDPAGQVSLQPAAIDLADTTTTRWDFYQFSSGDTLALVVNGYPSEFAKIDRYPNSNVLTAATFAAANFLAVVKDSSNNVFTAGGLSLKTAPAATNDLFTSATKITKVPFTSFVNTSAANPTEQLTGSGAGSEITPQGDPTPKDPAVVNAGGPCSGAWPSGSNVFRSVWYEFTPSATNNYLINTAGSRYDTGVYVFTGSPSSPTPVACNDDAPFTTVGVESSYVNFAATAGTLYYIMVSEVPPAVGFDAPTDSIPLAVPLATDATLQFSLKVGSAIVLSPNWVLPSFGGQKVKTTSAAKQITATNTTSKAVDVSQVQVIATGAPDFSAANNNCVGTLNPGASCTINVTFTPKTAAQFAAYVVLHVSTGVSPTAIQVTGFGF